MRHVISVFECDEIWPADRYSAENARGSQRAIYFDSLRGASVTRAVSFDIPENLPLVSMDSELITHVFINLFSNAFKYSPRDQRIGGSGPRHQ